MAPATAEHTYEDNFDGVNNNSIIFQNDEKVAQIQQFLSTR